MFNHLSEKQKNKNIRIALVIIWALLWIGVSFSIYENMGWAGIGYLGIGASISLVGMYLTGIIKIKINKE